MSVRQLEIDIWDFETELREERNKWPRNEIGRERLQIWLLKKFPEILHLHLLEASLYQDTEIDLVRDSDYYGENTTYEFSRGNFLDITGLYKFLIECGYIGE